MYSEVYDIYYNLLSDHYIRVSSGFMFRGGTLTSHDHRIGGLMWRFWIGDCHEVIPNT
jgi:hypothetical protein